MAQNASSAALLAVLLLWPGLAIGSEQVDSRKPNTKSGDVKNVAQLRTPPSEREPPQIKKLRPYLLAALGDSEASVRSAAVAALTSMDFEGRDRGVTLSHETASSLAALYAGEPDGKVRTEIVRSFSQAAADTEDIQRVLLDALDDADAGARHFALRGVQELKLVAALPKAAKALGDLNWGVRMQAAALFVALGVQAVDYVDLLEQARERETDPVIRSTINRAIAKIRDAR